MLGASTILTDHVRASHNVIIEQPFGGPKIIKGESGIYALPSVAHLHTCSLIQDVAQKANENQEWH